VASLFQLLDIHKELDDLFLLHQRGLLRGDPISAAQRLDEYAESLLRHIHDEEEIIIPLYRERVEPDIGGAPEIFFNEHHKLRTYVELFKAEMPALRESSDIERDTLWLLDSQNTFKRLLVHHDVREKRFLYPRLDEVTTPAERVDIFTRLSFRPVPRIAVTQLSVQQYSAVS
jgi:hemerythrin-like domain-containing protein